MNVDIHTIVSRRKKMHEKAKIFQEITPKDIAKLKIKAKTH